MKRDRASELRAIADGRLMLNVRNGVTVARSMLARIADEFEALSTALAAKDAELAAVHQQYVDANEARIDAEAALAEARKALELAVTKEMVNAAYNEGKSRSMTGMPNDFRAVVHAALKAAMEAGRHD